MIKSHRFFPNRNFYKKKPYLIRKCVVGNLFFRMKLFFKSNISPDRWNTLENKTKVVIQSLSNGLSYFIFAFFETCTFGGCNMPPCTGFIVRQCKNKLFQFTKMSPPLYYQNVQVLYFENFHKKFCTVAMRNMTHTSYVVIKKWLAHCYHM